MGFLLIWPLQRSKPGTPDVIVIETLALSPTSRLYFSSQEMESEKFISNL